jgi:NADH dehydrogenase
MARNARVSHLLHVSALGADAASPAAYARSKAAGEAAVREVFPKATIFRPGLVFGPEDDFFNRFGSLLRLVPALPLFFGGWPRFRLDGLFLVPEIEAGTTRFQPVYVGDIAEAAQRAVTNDDAQGNTYELGGPSTYSYAELMGLIAKETRRHALMVPVPFFAASAIAKILQFAPVPPLTPDQVTLLKIDNVVSAGALGLGDLGINGTAAELILPTYLDSYRRGRTDSSPVAET